MREGKIRRKGNRDLDLKASRLVRVVPNPKARNKGFGVRAIRFFLSSREPVGQLIVSDITGHSGLTIIANLMYTYTIPNND